MGDFNTVHGSNTQRTETTGFQSILKHVSKLPGCAKAITAFCSLFHLSMPSSPNVTSLTKKASEPLHAAHSPHTPPSASLTAIKHTPTPTDSANLEEFKGLLSQWSTPQTAVQGKTDAELKQMAEKLQNPRLEELQTALKDSPLKSRFEVWNRHLTNLRAAVANALNPSAAPKKSNSYDVLSRDMYHILDRAQALYVTSGRGYLSPKDTKDYENDLAKFKEDYKAFRQNLHPDYDRLPPTEQEKIDKQLLHVSDSNFIQNLNKT